jgi:glycogen(starch) synthase
MTADAVGGVWQYALELSALLARDSVRVALATMGPAPTAAQAEEAAKIPGLVLHSTPFALEWMPSPWADVDRAGDWLLRLASDTGADVIHLNGFVHAALPWRARTVVVAHSCVSSWWSAVHGQRPPREWDEYRARVTRGLMAADAIVAPSHAMAIALREHYGLERRIRVIANCRDPRAFAARPKEPFIFSAGRMWDPAKNLAALRAAAPGLDWPVYLAGDGSEGADGGNLHALGKLSASDVAAWMGRATIYALPARYEPFGLSVLEAAMSGCALVLGDIPSLRENWSGVARFVHPERDAELTRTLNELARDPAECEELGRAARRRAARFTPARHAAAYRQLYEEMVTTHDRATHTARAV